MSNLQKNIKELAGQAADKLGFLLIETLIRGDERNRIIELFIDNEKGISTEDCALMSSEAGDLIEKAELISSKYRLEVSSPGVDRPLRYLQQYPKHINRKFEVSYSEDDVEKKYTGKLIRIENEELIFNSNNTETKININKIKSAKVIISF